MLESSGTRWEERMEKSMQISRFVQIEDGSACILSGNKVKLPLLMRQQLTEMESLFSRQYKGTGEGSLLSLLGGTQGWEQDNQTEISESIFQSPPSCPKCLPKKLSSENPLWISWPLMQVGSEGRCIAVKMKQELNRTLYSTERKVSSQIHIYVVIWLFSLNTL